LADLQVLMKPARVLVLSAAGTVPQRDIEQLGFRVVRRPFIIEDLMRTVRTVIA
jgi:hypothetical protein